MKRICALFVLMFGAGSAMAAQVETVVVHPTTFVDGSALSRSQIASTRIEYGTCSGTAFGTKQGEQSFAGPPSTAQSTYNVTVPNPGQTYCLRAYTRATAAAGGLESAATNVVNVAVSFPAPSPGTILSVTQVARVFVPGKAKIGAVAAKIERGTECGAFVHEDKNGRWYEIDKADTKSLTKAGRKAERIVAVCEA